MKSAWLMRGYRESVTDTDRGTPELVAELKAKEEEYIQNAYNGFVEARQNEGFPMCGMDEITVDYLLGVLAAHLKKYDVASRMVSSILTSTSANNRMKDRLHTMISRTACSSWAQFQDTIISSMLKAIWSQAPGQLTVWDITLLPSPEPWRIRQMSHRTARLLAGRSGTLG